MLCRLKGSFHTLAVTSALSPRQPVQTSHFSPYSVAVEPLFSHRGVTATSQMASRWLLCCPPNGPLHLVDVTFTFTFTYFYPPQNWPHLHISTNSLFLSLISMDPPWPLCHLSTLLMSLSLSSKCNAYLHIFSQLWTFCLAGLLLYYSDQQTFTTFHTFSL